MRGFSFLMKSKMVKRLGFSFLLFACSINSFAQGIDSLSTVYFREFEVVDSSIIAFIGVVHSDSLYPEELSNVGFHIISVHKDHGIYINTIDTSLSSEVYFKYEIRYKLSDLILFANEFGVIKLGNTSYLVEVSDMFKKYVRPTGYQRGFEVKNLFYIIKDDSGMDYVQHYSLGILEMIYALEANEFLFVSSFFDRPD